MGKQKVEITDEMLEYGIACSISACDECKISNGNKPAGYCIERLAAALKAEREERKLNPGVWDGVPDDSRSVEVERIFHSNGLRIIDTSSYTRTLPKSKAREIAEKKVEKLMEPMDGLLTEKEIADAIEAAILEYTKETK